MQGCNLILCHVNYHGAYYVHTCTHIYYVHGSAYVNSGESCDYSQDFLTANGVNLSEPHINGYLMHELCF